MLKLFEIGNVYVRQSDWKDLALVKLCLFSMGILVALRLPLRALPKARKWPHLPGQLHSADGKVLPSSERTEEVI